MCVFVWISKLIHQLGGICDWCHYDTMICGALASTANVASTVNNVNTIKQNLNKKKENEEREKKREKQWMIKECCVFFFICLFVVDIFIRWWWRCARTHNGKTLWMTTDCSEYIYSNWFVKCTIWLKAIYRWPMCV